MPEQAAPLAKPTTYDRFLYLTLILLLAAVLRFYQLAGSSLWSDEGNTWALLARSFPQIAHDAAADIHPPGYYWLLKVWSMGLGTSAWAMRSFSAVAGIVLVWVIYRIGRYFADQEQGGTVALLAALLAAVNPFQIYYSQEARMYLLLALESALLFWALYALVSPKLAHGCISGKSQALLRGRCCVWPFLGMRAPLLPALGYVLSGVAGLWTHYSFPIVLAAAGLAFLLHEAPFLVTTEKTTAVNSNKHRRPRLLGLFLVLNLLIILAYLPWLPTAIARVLHWPKGGEAIAVTDGLRLTTHTLVFGPLRNLPAVQWPWVLVAALLPLLALILSWRQRKVWPLLLWGFAPILFMFGLGLFSDAFLKFLLIASPAWCLLSASGLQQLPKPRFWSLLCGVGAVALAGLTLPPYYTSPTARDNYAGIAQYLQAAAPAEAIVVLDAPGQQEVWRYYQETEGLTVPTVALPQQRPPNPAATLATLTNAVAGRQTVYALFWATDEADPDRLVEHWLDQHAFKGIDRWQGNLRLVTYSLPIKLACTGVTPVARFGDAIQLTERCQPPQQTVTAGDVALVGLHWQTLTPLTQRYKVTVQLLDSRNNVIAQRDSEPVGGSLPTEQWAVGQTVVDNHGILVPPGTPPGAYRLILALYDPNTGERLRLSPADDYLVLGEVAVVRPPRPLPTALLPLQHLVERPIGPLTLVGYSAHRKDMAHAPDTPLVAGDQVEFTFFWQAPTPLPADWPADLTVTLTLGDQSLTMPVAGGGYPTRQWQAGEQIRSKAELLYTAHGQRPRLTIGEETLPLSALPGRPWWIIDW